MNELFNLLKQVFEDKKNVFEWELLLANVLGGLDQKEQGNFVEHLIITQLQKIDSSIQHCSADGVAVSLGSKYKNSDIFLPKGNYGANIKSNISKNVANKKGEPSNSFNIKIFDNSRNKRKVFDDRMKEIDNDEIILSISFDKDIGNLLWVAVTSLQEIKKNCGYNEIKELFDDITADHVKMKLSDLIRSAKKEGRFFKVKLSKEKIEKEVENCKKYPMPFMDRLYYSHNKEEKLK